MTTFTRGLKPKEAMGIGMAGILKEIGGKIIDEKEFKKHKKEGSPENVVILVAKGKYKIIKNHIRLDLDNNLPEGPESELYDILLKLQEAFRKYGADWFDFPTMQKVSAKTIGLDLVAIQPMSAPIGSVHYFQYKNKKLKRLEMAQFK